MSVSYVAIDYNNNKYLIDLIEATVQSFNSINKEWNDLLSSNISKSYSSLKDSNILTFVDNGLAYTIQFSLISDFICCMVYNKIDKTIEFLDSNYFAYDFDTKNDLFINDESGIPHLNRYTFYSITESDLQNLSLEPNRVLYLLNEINKLIKENKDYSYILKYYANLLANLVYKNNPDLEKIFNTGDTND